MTISYTHNDIYLNKLDKLHWRYSIVLLAKVPIGVSGDSL